MSEQGRQLAVDQRGSPLLPSVVGVGATGVVVGRAARNQLLLEPHSTVARCKRLMGTDTRLDLGDRRVTPTEVSAFILAELLDRAQGALGVRPERAIITVPAFFDDKQRQATRDAGEIAGLRVERLVNEPTAAALNYETGGEERVLVYDFGGGTFDVSILERDADFLEVRSSHGDVELGGADLDAALVAHVLSTLGDERRLVQNDPRAMTRLTESLERAKIALSKSSSVQLSEPFLTSDGTRVVNLDLELSRATLERLAEPLVTRTLQCIDRALADAATPPESLDRIILVGGSSRMPYVAQRVSAHLGMPTQVDDEADVAVVFGAVRLAARAQGLPNNDVLVDVTPHTLAVGADDGMGRLIAAPLIQRNAVVPCEHTDTFFTNYDNQEVVEIPIVQGEHALAADNSELGVMLIEQLPTGPAGSPIKVSFRLDLSGVLNASALHVASGLQTAVRIADSPMRLTRQQRRAAQSHLEKLRAERTTATEGADPAEATLARALLERAETVLHAHDTKATPSAVARVTAAISGVQAALDDDPSQLAQASDALSDALLDLI
jgi:molecular chaperone DnaK